MTNPQKQWPISLNLYVTSLTLLMLPLPPMKLFLAASSSFAVVIVILVSSSLSVAQPFSSFLAKHAAIKPTRFSQSIGSSVRGMSEFCTIAVSCNVRLQEEAPFCGYV